MEKLKRVIGQYQRWSPLTVYTERVDAYLVSDFSLALENAKAILETIGKEICTSKNVALESTATINSVLKKAFTALGYNSTNLVTQISASLATIGQKMGDLRNEIGSTAHGRSLDELQERNSKVDELTKEFLIDATVIVACFLIRTFETETPLPEGPKEAKLILEEQEVFNEFLDEAYGEFVMGEYSYPASEILFHVDYPAYVAGQNAFIENQEGDE